MHGYICCTCMSSHASVYICAFMCLCTPFDTPMNMWSAPPPWKSLLTVDPCSSINRFRTLGKRTPSVRRSRGNITPCNLFCMHYLVSCSTPTTLVIRVRLVDRLVHIFLTRQSDTKHHQTFGNWRSAGHRSCLSDCVWSPPSLLGDVAVHYNARHRDVATQSLVSVACSWMPTLHLLPGSNMQRMAPLGQCFQAAKLVCWIQPELHVTTKWPSHKARRRQQAAALRLMCCSAWFWWLKGHVGYTLSVEGLEVSNWPFKKERWWEMSLCGPVVSSRPFTHLAFNTLHSTSKGQETVPTQTL